MKFNFRLLTFALLLSTGCTHRAKPAKTAFTMPWQNVSNGVAELVGHHARFTEFKKFQEVSSEPERLQTFDAVEKIIGNRQTSSDQRSEHVNWFTSSASVWHYVFECQFSAIFFLDRSGHVQHAILLG
jgi:hypothetical protein